MQKVVLVTGGGQGIGRAVALRFAQERYAVSIADVDNDAGLEVIKQIRQMGGNAMYMNADIADDEAVARWVRLTRDELGGIDALINNAGIGRGGSMLELALSAFDRVIAVNLRGTFVCSQQAARYMKERGGGCIVNMASTRALMSEADTEAYAASKGGIVSLTHAMAISLGKYRIRVNAISPGWIETADWQYSTRAEAPRHRDRDRLQHPVGRVGVPDDIASACWYLCGPEAGFITGQNVVIDGGMTVKMIYEE